MQEINLMQEQLLFKACPLTDKEIRQVSTPASFQGRKMTLIYLCGYANSDGELFAGLAHVSQRMGIDRGTITEHVEALERTSLMERLGKKGNAYIRQITIPDLLVGTVADPTAGSCAGVDADPTAGTTAGTSAGVYPHEQNRPETEQNRTLPVDDLSAQLDRMISMIKDRLSRDLQIKRTPKVEAALYSWLEAGLTDDLLIKQLMHQVDKGTILHGGGVVILLEQFADDARSGRFNDYLPRVDKPVCVDLPDGTMCDNKTHTAFDSDGNPNITWCPNK